MLRVKVLGGNPSLLYPTSKGAIIQMTRAMAAQHGPENIRVNCVAPGMVYTPMVRGRGMSEEMRQAVCSETTQGAIDSANCRGRESTRIF
jgi:NAD(P)-dependent dehydrogenase (short-subunit alcohol dehydrogenase family)